MEALTSNINVQVDKEDKEIATNILKSLGLNMSTAINMFIKQIINTDGLPFEVKNPRPSKELLEALKEVEEMKKYPDRYPSYDNREDLKKALLSDD